MMKLKAKSQNGKAKNKCTSINKRATKDYFKEATKHDLMKNKDFWEKLKPFLPNKWCFSEDQISIEINDELVSDEQILSDIFNKHYVKVVEKSSGTKPSSLGDSRNLLLDETMVGKVIDTYRDHPGVITIKSSVTQKSMFSL